VLKECEVRGEILALPTPAERMDDLIALLA
jgi:hypothetical protein